MGELALVASVVFPLCVTSVNLMPTGVFVPRIGRTKIPEPIPVFAIATWSLSLMDSVIGIMMAGCT